MRNHGGGKYHASSTCLSTAIKMLHVGELNMLCVCPMLSWQTNLAVVLAEEVAKYLEEHVG